MPRWLWFCVLVLVPVSFGVLSLALGKDYNWDLRNYHYYNAFAFLDARMGFDLAPAQMQTFHNPLLDVPYFWLSQRLPAKAVGFLFGILHGLNFTLVFLLYWAVARFPRRQTKIVFGLLTAGFACLVPSFVCRVGTTFNDNLVSLFVLCALILLVWPEWAAGPGVRTSIVLLAVSGFVMGAGTGLKLTAAFCAPAAAAALFALAVPWWWRVRAVGLYILAGTVGYLATSGFWMLKLWREFGNPIFPYFNHLFRSSEAAPISFEYSGFADSGAWTDSDKLVNLLAGARRVILSRGFDWLALGLFVASVILVLVRCVRRLSSRRREPAVAASASESRDLGLDRDRSNLLVVFYLLALAMWARMFPIDRYLLPVGLVAPVIVLILLDRLLCRELFKLGAFVGLGLVVLVTSEGRWTPRVEWDEQVFAITNPEFWIEERALVVIVDRAPVACFIPAFPREVAFVRPYGGLKLAPEHGLHRRIVRRIQEYDGPTYVMFDLDSEEPKMERARRVGLKAKKGRCRRLARPGERSRVVVCPATKEP